MIHKQPTIWSWIGGLILGCMLSDDYLIRRRTNDRVTLSVIICTHFLLCMVLATMTGFLLLSLGSQNRGQTLSKWKCTLRKIVSMRTGWLSKRGMILTIKNWFISLEKYSYCNVHGLSRYPFYLFILGCSQ